MTTPHDRSALHSYSLARDGERPLAVRGEVLAQSAGQWYEGVARPQWYDLTIYRTHDDHVVVHWEYATQPPGAGTHAAVAILATVEDALTALNTWDPRPWVAASLPAMPPDAAEAIVEEVFERYILQTYDVAQALGGTLPGMWGWSG
jgi:hypothetical protein